MKFTEFRIRNYRGINDTRLVLNGGSGSIYTLVGLNESGKTTILEALNNFRHDVDGVHALAQREISSDPIEALVPKKQKDNFNGNIAVAAKVKLTESEVTKIAAECQKQHEFKVEIDSFPREFFVTRKHHFENSEHTKSKTYWDFGPKIKKKGARKFVEPDASEDEWQIIIKKIGNIFPRIIYFPTFLFNFPERIQITDGESEIEGNNYFKKMIEDALASLDSPLDLKKLIS